MKLIALLLHSFCHFSNICDNLSIEIRVILCIFLLKQNTVLNEENKIKTNDKRSTSKVCFQTDSKASCHLVYFSWNVRADGFVVANTFSTSSVVIFSNWIHCPNSISVEKRKQISNLSLEKTSHHYRDFLEYQKLFAPVSSLLLCKLT